VELPGTLDVAPPAGTWVKVLVEDDEWHAAEVIASKGSKAKLRFEDGDEDVVDFEEHAVRLHGYVSDDEEDEEHCSSSDIEEIYGGDWTSIKSTPSAPLDQEADAEDDTDSCTEAEEDEESEEGDDDEDHVDLEKGFQTKQSPLGESADLAPCAAVIGRSM